MTTDRVEYYNGDAKHPMVSIESSIVPTVGSFVSIEKVTWIVKSVTFAVDYSASAHKEHRANVTLEKCNDN